MFPVKLTDPLSALLYITFDYEHMDNLKHTIHVREINIGNANDISFLTTCLGVIDCFHACSVAAPAHEAHVMAVHRTGHHLGGLPTLFWGSLAFLIVIFHLFLAKLIYNEYCVSPQDRYIRTRYSL